MSKAGGPIDIHIWSTAITFHGASRFRLRMPVQLQAELCLRRNSHIIGVPSRAEQ